MEKKSRKQSIAEASIEDLVNSSLDLAAESVNADTPHKVDEVDVPVQAEELNELDDIDTPKDSNIESVTEIKASSKQFAPAPEPLNTESQQQNKKADRDLNLACEEKESSQIDEPETTESLNINDVTTEISEPEPIQKELSSPKTSIESLEIEASELESEILIEMDKLVAKADHLKDNIQSKLQDVCTENEQLQQEVSVLKEKLSTAEDKIQSLSDDQSRQQATLKKIIMILKGVNAKISHL